MTGEEYTVVSADAVYTATVADNYDANRIVAVWSETPTLPEKARHDITAVKGFAWNNLGGMVPLADFVSITK